MTQNKRGGKRPNSGRKPGSGKGRTVKTSSISLTPSLWAAIDKHRGELSRSKWIAALVEKHLRKTKKP